MFIFERERERQSMNRGGAEREGDTESEAGSRLWAVSTEPDSGLELTNWEIMTWAEIRWNQMLNPLSHPGTLNYSFLILSFFYVYLFLTERETEHEQGRGRERGRHRIWNRLQALSCQQSLTRGSNSWTMRLWPEPKSDAQPTELSRRPWFTLLLMTNWLSLS